MSTDFRTEPPWQEGDSIPPEYTIVAELPCVIWGWEIDLYYWILKDQDGALVLGASSHGRFYLANADSLKEKISTLSGYLEATKSALHLIAAAQPTPHAASRSRTQSGNTTTTTETP